MILDTVSTIFSYPFLIRAVIVGVLVSLCASLLGVSLVLKRYSMIGDGLSHVGFGALAVAAALNAAPLSVAVPVCIICAVCLLGIKDSSKLAGDAAIAIVSSGALAIGIMVISMSSGMNTDVYNYMFGSILALSHTDTVLCVVISVVIATVYILFYNRIFSFTFDDVFARATGTRTGVYSIVLAVLTAVTVVIGMRMMGALLISSLIIFPATTSMRICRTYKRVIVLSAVISVICFVVGMILSFNAMAPVGASIVVVNMAVFFVAVIWSAIKNRRSRKNR